MLFDAVFLPAYIQVGLFQAYEVGTEYSVDITDVLLAVSRVDPPLPREQSLYSQSNVMQSQGL